MDFGPYVVGLFLYEDFWKMIFWLVLKLEIGYYRVIISWSILVSLRGFFGRLDFCMVKYLNFHNSSFDVTFRLFFNINGKPTVWYTQPPCWFGLMDGMNKWRNENLKTHQNCPYWTATTQLFKNSPPSFHPQLLGGSRSGMMPARSGQGSQGVTESP
jgi:hypothetical protein